MHAARKIRCAQREAIRDQVVSYRDCASTAVSTPTASRNPPLARGAQTQFRGDLPVGQVQTYEVEAQHPDPQRLVVPAGASGTSHKLTV